MRRGTISLIALAAFALSGPAAAQDLADPAAVNAFMLETALYIAGGLGGVLFVFALGLRDVGLAKPQHAPGICLRTIGLVAVTAFSFWLVGYNLIALVEKGGLLGAFEVWRPDDTDPAGLGAASGAHWFFYMALAAIPPAIVSSAVSERVKLWPFLIFTAAMAGVVFPIAASWVLGGGYLAEAWRVHDTGGGLVHITGGAAAFAAALAVGPRPGRYQDGMVTRQRTTALPLAAFSVGAVVVSWVVVMNGLTGSLISIEGAVAAGGIAVRSIFAAASGILAAIILTQLVYKRAGLVSSINGAIGGLVALSPDPLHPQLWQAVMIGAAGGVIVTVTPPFLDRFRIDDAGFSVPAHFICGVWGMMIVPWSNPEAGFLAQLVSVTAIAVFSFSMSILIWTALKYSIGVRFKPGDNISYRQPQPLS